MSNTGSSATLSRVAGPRSELPVPRVRTISSRGTIPSSASSRPSRTSTSRPAQPRTSQSYEPLHVLPTAEPSSGSGNNAGDGKQKFSSVLAKKRTDFSLLLKQTMTKRGVTTQRLSDLTDIPVYSINRYRSSNPQLPRPEIAAKLAEALMEPRLRSTASVSRTCETCSKTFELTSKKRSGHRFCSESCQRAARSKNDHEKTNVRLSAERSRALQDRDQVLAAVRRFCDECALGSWVCPDRTCPLAEVTHLPMRKEA